MEKPRFELKVVDKNQITFDFKGYIISKENLSARGDNVTEKDGVFYLDDARINFAEFIKINSSIIFYPQKTYFDSHTKEIKNLEEDDSIFVLHQFIPGAKGLFRSLDSRRLFVDEARHTSWQSAASWAMENNSTLVEWPVAIDDQGSWREVAECVEPLIGG